MNQRKGSPLGLYTIGIAALFLAGFLLLVVFGARSYQSTVTGQNENMKSRSLLSYLATTVHGYDTGDAVTVEDSEHGPLLVIADGNTGYALRIYRYEGALVEDYAVQTAPLAPERAQVIGSTDIFEIEQLSDSLFRIATDEGSVLLHIRSKGEKTA